MVTQGDQKDYLLPEILNPIIFIMPTDTDLRGLFSSFILMRNSMSQN